MTNLHTASSQLASRPADESFGTLEAFLNFIRQQKATSRERTRAIRDLRANPTDTGSVVLTNPEGINGTFTHWSFGQLARTLKAPADYLRRLPADIAAAAINYGIQNDTPRSQDVQILAQAAPRLPGDTTTPTVKLRAITGDGYGRIWDADLYGDVIDMLASRGYDLPPVWPHLDHHGTGKAGAYASDRDSFLILASGGSMVTDPSAARSVLDRNGSDGTAMHRAIMMRNSEVGASSAWIMSILYRVICGNHILWNVDVSSKYEYRRRHVGDALRDVTRAAVKVATLAAERSAAQDEQIIRLLIDREVAKTRDAVIDELRTIGYTEAAATAAYEVAERQEISTASPRSYWGIVQATTWTSQQSSTGHQDARLQLDQLAAALLARGRALVTA